MEELEESSGRYVLVPLKRYVVVHEYSYGVEKFGKYS